ncbi:LOW QUALITY PROTEIN: hypothetical protein HID58_019298, partial [Brassica napus]
MSHPRRKTATLVFIDDIKPGNNSYKLKVMKLWKLWRSKKVVSIEMVLVDATEKCLRVSLSTLQRDQIMLELRSKGMIQMILLTMRYRSSLVAGVLSPQNEDVDKINEYMLSQIK